MRGAGARGVPGARSGNPRGCVHRNGGLQRVAGGRPFVSAEPRGDEVTLRGQPTKPMLRIAHGPSASELGDGLVDPRIVGRDDQQLWIGPLQLVQQNQLLANRFRVRVDHPSC